MISRVVGAPAVGEAFFDREELIARICSRLKSGSVLLVAPRRFGKTSIMLKVKEKLVAEKKLALYLDVEWVSHPSDFITEILYKLRENANQSFSALVKNLPKGLLNSVKKNIDTLEIVGFRLKLREELKDAWIEKGREIFKVFRILNMEIVLFVDEFPLMLYNMHVRKNLDLADIRNFLYWLRSMRIETNLRMVLGGSIGIDHVLKSLDAGASINDLERIFVGPLNREDASKFVISLFESERIKIDSKSVEKILEVLEVPIPYFIQIMVSALLNEVRGSRAPISTEMVEDVYRKRVLGVECWSYFEHYFQRLSMYYSPQDAGVSKKLLKELALRNKMSKKDLFKSYSVYAQSDDVERFNYIVSELENDFYIQFDEKKGEYSFATKVLKDLWLRRYEVLE